MDKKRLIYADALQRRICGAKCGCEYEDCGNEGDCEFDFFIFHAPTVDAVEVVHGRWIPLEYDGYADGYPVWDLWECSECGEEHKGDEDTLTNYCPNCGAKMDGKDDT